MAAPPAGHAACYVKRMRHPVFSLFCVLALGCSGGGSGHSPGLDAGVDADVPDAQVDSGPACRQGEQACGPECANLTFDGAHCGDCETACEPDTVCLAGACGAPPVLPYARVGASAAMTADGLVYLVGGIDGEGYVVDTAEVLDPATAVWTPLAAMPRERGIYALAVGAEGALYAFGGVDRAITFLRTVDVYDPATDAWSTLADETPGAAAQLAVATDPDGKIYLIGGSTGAQISAFVDIFDSSTGEWSSGAVVPTPRFGLAADRGPDGRIVAVGGGVPDGTGSVTSLETVEAYDPASDSWEGLSPMSTPRFEPVALFGPDGRLYVTGGHGADHVTQATAEVYDPATDTWTDLPPMTWPRAGHTAVFARDGRLHVFGGHGVVDSEVLDTMEIYDPGTDRWVSSPSNLD
jgi:N-acetylneuraminic acid mutarotase